MAFARSVLAVRALNRRPRLVLLLSALTAGGTVAAIAVSDSPRSLWRALDHIQPLWLLAALGVEAVAYLGYVVAYRETILAAQDSRPSVVQTVQLVIAGFGPSAASGGFAFDRRALKALHYSRRRARIQVLELAVIEYLLLAPAACVCALILIFGSQRASLLLTLPWAAAVPVGLLLGWWATHPRVVAYFCDSPGRGRRWIGDLLAGIEILRSAVLRPVEHRGAIVGVALYWSAEIVCLGFALRCFGVEISVPALILAYATGYAASRRSLPLGGAGLVEALLTVSLIAVHVDAASALVSVLAYRVVNLLLPMLAGLVAHYSLAPLLDGRARG
jgi:uncharacterized membrane protein YbhN (UPF0104 family)